MSNYDIYKTDGITKYTIPEKGFNNETDVTFIGNNAQKYGEYLQQNFINLLTNFYALQLDLFICYLPNDFQAKKSEEAALEFSILHYLHVFLQKST